MSTAKAGLTLAAGAMIPSIEADYKLAYIKASGGLISLTQGLFDFRRPGCWLPHRHFLQRAAHPPCWALPSSCTRSINAGAGWQTRLDAKAVRLAQVGKGPLDGTRPGDYPCTRAQYSAGVLYRQVSAALSSLTAAALTLRSTEWSLLQSVAVPDKPLPPANCESFAAMLMTVMRTLRRRTKSRACS